MKVLFQVRSDLFKRRGGDTVQVENTAKSLEKLGVSVDISSSNSLDLSMYDLVHIFQLDWTCEPYLQAMNAKKNGLSLVLSPIHHSEAEVKRFEDTERYDLRRIVNPLFRSQESRDVLKNVYRALFEFDTSKIYPTFLSIKDGYRNEQREVLNASDLVLVQTEIEARDVERDFNTKVEWKKIVNGVGEMFYKEDRKSTLEGDNNIVTVGRIEARKNQLRIIEAVDRLRKEGENLKLIIVGLFNERNFEYSLRVREKIKEYEWITYIQKIEYDKMPELYKDCKVCVSASWFETSGLTLLEALFCYCNVVASGERAREYLGENAFYCDPNDIDSIKKALKEAFYSERPEIDDSFRKTYTWDEVARNTLEAYNYVLNKTL